MTENTTEKKVAFVNFASKNGWYLQGQERLKKYWESFGNGYDLICFQDEDQIGSPKHSDNPYAFKVYAMQAVRDMGYDIVVYMDASMWPVTSVQPLIDWIEQKGYLMEEAGHWSGTWANDRSLEYFKMSRDEAMKIPMFSAGMLGLDFRSELCREFFARWKNACQGGIFRGGWQNRDKSESQDPRCQGHRHDMTCASIIAKGQLSMEYSPGGHFLSYIGTVYGQPSKTSIFHLQPTA